MANTYGGSNKTWPSSYQTRFGKKVITHNYTVTHLDSFGKVAYIEVYETPFGKPFGLGGNQLIATQYPKLNKTEFTANASPDARKYFGSASGEGQVLTKSQETTKDAIQQNLTNNNPDGLTPQEIATRAIKESRDIHSQNSTVAPAPATAPTNNNPGNQNNTAAAPSTPTATGNQPVPVTPGNQNPKSDQPWAKDNRNLRYPLKHASVYDFIQIYPMQYIPAIVPGSTLSTSANFSNVSNRYTAEKAGSTIFLPMIPASETSSTGWGEDSLNAIQKEFGKAASDTIRGAFEKKNFTDWGSGALKSLKSAAHNLIKNDKDLAQFLTAHFAGQAVNANLLGRHGVAINPNLELLFSGPSLRSFSYNFRFTPREKDEAKEIRDIIKVFKKGMAPRRKDGDIFLNVPYVWQLEYIRGGTKDVVDSGKQHPYLNKIKPCALKSFNVNYMPEGSYMTYGGSGGPDKEDGDDGSMTSYQVSMEFGELEPIYNNDIEMDEKDMGY